MGKLKIDCRTGVISPSSDYTNKFMNGEKVLFSTYSSGSFNSDMKKMKAVIFGNFIMELAEYMKSTRKITTTLHAYNHEDGSFMMVMGNSISIGCNPMLKSFDIKFKSISIGRTDYVNVQAHILDQKLNIDILEAFHYVSRTWSFPENMIVPDNYKEKFKRFNKKRNDERNQIT